MRIHRVVLVFSMLAIVVAATGQAPSAGQQAFERMITLVGEWEGTHGTDGKWAKASYELTSEGTVLTETLREQDGHSMLTTYYVDGDRLMMTHYCSAGNQPRMVAAEFPADGKQIRFRLQDITNLPSPSAGHMAALEIAFVDAAHHTAQWTWREKGKDAPPEVFQLARVK